MLNITNVVTNLLVRHLYNCFQRSTFCPELPALQVILDTENALRIRTITTPQFYANTITA